MVVALALKMVSQFSVVMATSHHPPDEVAGHLMRRLI